MGAPAGLGAPDGSGAPHERLGRAAARRMGAPVPTAERPRRLPQRIAPPQGGRWPSTRPGGPSAVPDPSGSSDDYVHRHVRFGWWSFLVFATFGLVLETFHGFKLGAYLDASQETRRLMWTLAHAHGTLLSVVHIVFGTYTRMFPLRDMPRQRF